MAKKRVIIDCYTDEPAGLGVPPFIGVWPRIVFGSYRDNPEYLTIDDLRSVALEKKLSSGFIDPLTGKTRKELLNRTREIPDIKKIIHQSKQFIFILGIHTPGKYLRAQPGSMRELRGLMSGLKGSRILTGPIAFGGSQRIGGTNSETVPKDLFNEIRTFNFDSYSDIENTMLQGAKMVKQIKTPSIAEIETGRGCLRKEGCSFCTEPLKNKPQWRRSSDIIKEVAELQKNGINKFRLGKQSCIYSYQNGDIRELEALLKGISDLSPEVFHIDNGNPARITEEKTKLFIKYLSPGSTVAMGVESFDPNVIDQNNLNSDPDLVFNTIEIINKLGRETGINGCPKLLPGINILLGLKGETQETLEINFQNLKKILDKDLLIRRINIRQVVPFPGTYLGENVGRKFLKKNHHLYRKWTDKVRRNIDLPMLKKIFPEKIILKKLFSEVHDGNITFLRQIGSYPIVVGVKERLPLGNFYDIEVIGHMLRSIEGRVVKTY